MQIVLNSLAAMKRAIKDPEIQIRVLEHWQPRLKGTVRMPLQTRKSGKPGIQTNGYYFEGPRHNTGEIVEMWAEFPPAKDLRFNEDGTVTFYPDTPKSWTLRFEKRETEQEVA